ncbi:MAG: hypothetical protein JXK07_13490 [Spirochaetes bacterium]|nr:hypothetical protein [Spirochaetota bacterium]
MYYEDSKRYFERSHTTLGSCSLKGFSMIFNDKNSSFNFQLIRKNKNLKDDESIKNLISYYEKLTDSLSKKIKERQSEITDLWLTIKTIQAICEQHKEIGIDFNTLKQIIFMTQRH